MGYIRRAPEDAEIGHPDFGRLMPCPRCNRQTIWRLAGLREHEVRIRLEDIETRGRPGTKRMVEAARVFLAAPCGFLAVHGGYGNGKSTLLKAIVNECLERGVEARYITMAEVMAYAREAFESEIAGDTDYGRIEQLARQRVLVIDEVDKARPTDYTREVQTHLFDLRYRLAEVLGTVVAWNGSFEAVEMPWLRSRLSEFVVVENWDTDMRPLIGGAHGRIVDEH